MKRSIPLVLILSIILLGIAVQSTAQRPAAQPQAQGPFEASSQTDMQGAVAVEVTPLNFAASAETLDFDVKMNTHSVDLDMDFAALSTLTTSSGLAVKAIAWDGGRGGHHVSGKLSFPAIVDGARLISQSKSLVLTIRDVDAPERTFKWEIK